MNSDEKSEKLFNEISQTFLLIVVWSGAKEKGGVHEVVFQFFFSLRLQSCKGM